MPSSWISTPPNSSNSPARGDLDVRAEADAELLDVAPLAPGGLVGTQLVVPRDATRLVEGHRVLADVVVRAGERREREALGREEVPLAELDRVDAELDRRPCP